MAVIWGLGWLLYRSYDLFYHSFKSGRAWLFVFRALTTLLTVALSLFVPALVAEWLGLARPDATPLAWLGLLYAIPPLAMIESRRDNAFLAIAFASGGAVIVHVIFLVRDPAQGLSTIASFALIIGLALTVSACNSLGSTPSGNTSMEKSLYDRLGGKTAITAVVDDFVGRVAADTRINGKFANANIPRLKSMLVDQICQASGGPCTYTGRDMKSTHAGMGVSSSDFDALVGDLVATLNKFKVPEREKNELLGALGPMKSDIVEKPMASMQ